MNELPHGYKERTESMVLEIMPIARKLFGIVREFESEKIILDGNTFEVEIKQKKG